MVDWFKFGTWTGVLFFCLTFWYYAIKLIFKLILGLLK